MNGKRSEELTIRSGPASLEEYARLMQNAITNESSVFRITSTGFVVRKYAWL